jgi:tryptophanyl-tRNA synthetase
MLVDLAVEKLAPISKEMARMMQHTSNIDAVLKSGSSRAREIATPIVAQAYDIVGMLRS